MPRRDGPGTGSEGADVCLVVEGTYPYLRGGVSTWVHGLIQALPTVRFALAHIGAARGSNPDLQYELPQNVVALHHLYCREPLPRQRELPDLRRRAQVELCRHAAPRGPSRVLRALRALHLEEPVDQALLEDLASGDLSVGALLHGRASFELTMELCERLAPEASFVDFFWQMRSMHLPLVRLLAAEPPPAATYHALCTGLAGFAAAVWSQRTGRPLLLTEHGIYTRERSLELDRGAWSREARAGSGTASASGPLWDRYFRALARCTYARAAVIVSLSEVHRQRQIADGAPRERTRVVPNGVDVDGLRAHLSRALRRPADGRPLRVAFVGRLVPIKDVVTFIRACHLALELAALDVRIIGPMDEDRAYVRRCRRLVTSLGLERVIRFEGLLAIEHIYPAIDLLVLTSFSEGQPLVVLEANALGIPVVASDVGACRELIEGRSDADRRIGPSGIVTRLAAPRETAAAIVRLARDRALCRHMGRAGRQRVAMFYRQSTTVARYRELYGGGPRLALAGGSSA